MQVRIEPIRGSLFDFRDVEKTLRWGLLSPLLWQHCDELDSHSPTATTFFIFVLYIVLVLVEELIGSRLPNLRIYLISHLEVDIKAVLSPLGFRTISFHDEG